MITRNSVKWILMSALVLPNLTACSFGGSDEEVAEEVEGSEDEEAAVAEEGVENAEGENVAVEGAESNESNIGNESNVAFEDSGTGNATADNAFGNSDIPPELMNAEGSNPAMDAGMMPEGNAAMAADAGMPEANAMPADAGMAPPADAGMAPPADAGMAAAPAPAASVPSGGERVYYVTAASVALRSSPDAAGQSVGSLSKGDPVLARVEGSWANILNRGYVELSSLSETPVGRDSSAKSWQ